MKECMKIANEMNWFLLSSNPYVIDLLEENKELINWKQLSKNPSIFIYDNELLEKILSPDYLDKQIHKYGFNVIYDIYF